MLAALLRAGHAPVHVFEEDSAMARMKGPWWNNLVAERHAPLPMQLADQIREYNSSAAVPIVHSMVRSHNECADAIRADSVDLLVLANTRIIKAEVLEAARSGALNCHPDYVSPQFIYDKRHADRSCCLLQFMTILRAVAWLSRCRRLYPPNQRRQTSGCHLPLGTRQS
jgi:hypothetical protein